MIGDPQALYVQLGRLVEATPNLKSPGGFTSEGRHWIARVIAIANASGEIMDATTIQKALIDINHSAGISTSYMNNMRNNAADRITDAMLRVFYKLEILAPQPVQGAFIPAGNALDAMAATGKVLGTAKRDLLIVDPYMDEKALTDFAALAPEGVAIRLLADAKHHKATLEPASTRWATQYGATRPLEVRLTPDRTLHDRLVIVDDATVWVLTQSLNAFAARAPASIVRSDGDAAGLKIAAYADLWTAATPI